MAGRDRLFGGEHDDVLHGGEDDDELSGMDGQDDHFGAGGNDVIRSKDGWKDRVHCGPGMDELFADELDEVADCETSITESRGAQR